MKLDPAVIILSSLFILNFMVLRPDKKIMKKYKKWRDEADAERRKRSFYKGYEWAAGILLKKGYEDGEVEIRSMTCGFDRNEFDEGAGEAVRDFTTYLSDPIYQLKGTR